MQHDYLIDQNLERAYLEIIGNGLIESKAANQYYRKSRTIASHERATFS